jgi:cellobiose-specific phosphotransferase system component IIC
MVDPAHEHVEPAHSHVSPAPVATSRSWAGIAVRIVLTLVGAAGLVISAFVDWVVNNGASDISVRALWSTRFAHPGNDWLTSIAAVVVALALIAILGLAPRTGVLTSLAGALGIAVFVLLLVQLYRADLTVSDLDPGAWIGLAGSIVALIGGFLGSRTTVVATGPTVVAP